MKPYEVKQQLIIKKRKGAGLKHCKDSKPFLLNT